MNTQVRTQRSPQRGFTLIEVLISLVVVALGTVAVLKMTGVFLQTSNDAEQRALATVIAEKKVEELRSFDAVNASAAAFSAYENIVTTAPAAAPQSGDFDLGWTVTGFNVSSAGAASATSVATPSYKEITVTVSWEGGDKNVALSTLIASIDPNFTGFSELTGAGGGTPNVEYNPGGAPDVIPIDVGDNKLKETTKPLPDVTHNDDSVEVTFETITYRDVGGIIQLVQEEFLTVNCVCNLNTASTTSGLTPYYHKWEGEDEGLKIKAGESVQMVIGTEFSGGGFNQSDKCGRCCAGHHDSQDASSGIPKFTNAVSSAGGSFHGDHEHYRESDPDDQAQNNDTYLEACRFGRVDGVFRLFRDWELLEINVMPISYLASSASSSLATYQTYIKDRIEDAVFNTASAAALSGRDFETEQAELTQVLARSLYIDDILEYDTDLSAFLSGLSAASVAEQSWLQYIPFFEINTTLLSTWETTSTAVGTVTSEDVNNIVDPVADFYGTYSRGLVTGQATLGTANITASTKLDNTGLLGNTYHAGHPDQGADNRITPTPVSLLSASLTVSTAAPGASYFVSGGFIRTAIPDNVKLDNAGTTPVNVAVTPSPSSGAACEVFLDAGSKTGVFQCDLDVGYTGTISFSGNAGYTFTPSSISIVSISAPLDNQNITITD